MRTKEFKKSLARVFDENLHTRQWHNVADYVIIGLILLSTAAIFVSTFQVSPSVEKWIKYIDWFTQIFFTIEVTLRIWSADEIDPKYKGFWGRVKYCFSFYGLIDFLATYPFWLNYLIPLPVTALKSIRVLRLFRIIRIFRVFRYMKAFRFLGTAIKSKKNEMVVSMQFLVILTVALSFILYYVEHDANPEMIENGWESFVWAFAKYIGDPGKIADEALITTAGQIIAFIVGILGIAIFAVPIGLLGSGFSEAIEQEQKEDETKNNIEKLRKAFERKLDRPTGIQAVPMFLSTIDVQARMNMTETDIFEAINASNEFGVINIAATIPFIKNPSDRLAIEHFCVNRPYGLFIDRGSKITIISTGSMIDPLVGQFCFYFAMFGGFNYISREIGETRPYQSFYTPSNDSIPNYKEFIDDLNTLTARDGAWTITILTSSGAMEPEYPEELHIQYGAAKGDSSFNADNLLVHDFAKAEAIFSDIEARMQEIGIVTERQQRHKSDNPAIFLRKLEHAETLNSFILRIAWSAMSWNPNHLKIAQSIANTLHEHLEPERELDLSEMQKKDIGYRGYRI